MEIKEILNESGMKVKKLKYSCDEKVNVALPLMNNLHFFYMLCGKPASGKTTLLCSLVTSKKAYRKLFDKIFLFSPSLATLEKNPFSVLPEDQRFDELTETNLENVMEQIRGSGEKVLIIFDDCVADIKGVASLA